MLFVEGIKKMKRERDLEIIFSLLLSQANKYRNSVEQMFVDLESTTLVKSRRSVNFGGEKKMASLFLLT